MAGSPSSRCARPVTRRSSSTVRRCSSAMLAQIRGAAGCAESAGIFAGHGQVGARQDELGVVEHRLEERPGTIEATEGVEARIAMASVDRPPAPTRGRTSRAARVAPATTRRPRDGTQRLDGRWRRVHARPARRAGRVPRDANRVGARRARRSASHPGRRPRTPGPPRRTLGMRPGPPAPARPWPRRRPRRRERSPPHGRPRTRSSVAAVSCSSSRRAMTGSP